MAAIKTQSITHPPPCFKCCWFHHIGSHFFFKVLLLQQVKFKNQQCSGVVDQWKSVHTSVRAIFVFVNLMNFVNLQSTLLDL